VDNIDWNSLLFQFDGRINRGKFWLGTVIIWVAYIVIVGIAAAAEAVLVYVLALLLIWPGLAVSIKRWHDRDKSGWWVLIGLIPLIGPIWAFIETGFLEGTSGPNEYGPDPLGGGVADDMAM